MASSYMLRPLCTSHLLFPTPSSQDRICWCKGLRGRRKAAGRPALLFACSREVWLHSDFPLLSVKLTRPPARSNGILFSQGNVTGQQANAIANANLDATLVEAQPLSDENSTESNGSAAHDPVTDSGPDFGPEFDYQVYAANTMVAYEPPPPPRIPFGGPYEDYYDEYVGVDYVPKQEKPTSSFLMFLESLNEKRAEEEAKLREKDPTRPPFNPKPNKHLFEGSKPLFTIPRPIQPAHIPRDYLPPSLDPNEDATPRRIFSPVPPKKPKPQPQPQVAETTTAEEHSDPKSVTSSSDTEVLPSEAGGSASQAVGVEEFSPSSTVDLTPSYPAAGGIDNVTPSVSYDYSSPPLSSGSSAPTTTLMEEPSFDGRTSPAPSMSIADGVKTMPPSPSHKPFETTPSNPLVSSAKPFEAPVDASGSLFPRSATLTNGKSTVMTDKTTSFEAKTIEESRPVTIEKKNLEDSRDDRSSSFQVSRVEEKKPSVPSGPMVSPLGRPSDMVHGSGASAFPQTRLNEASGPYLQGQPAAGAISTGDLTSQPISFSSNVDASQGMFSQADRMILEGPGEMIRTSEFYEPNDGHIVLGVVTYADEDELSLEIGGRVPALMTMRDFQPFTEIGTDSFYKLPSNDVIGKSGEGFDALPHGKVLLVEDKEANDGIYRGENVNGGTIVVAEVHSKALVEGRPVLTCRRLARSLAFVRIEQIMRTGEPIEIEITQCNEGGLQGYLEGVRAFLPRSELLKRPENNAALQEYVGKTMRVALVQAEEYSSNVIISEVRLWMSENLLLGTVHDLIITRIHPYGLQVEVIGTRIRGFIHISSISRGYVTALPVFFVEGEEIKAMVIKGKKPGQVSFSIEAIEPPSEEGLFLRDKETVYYGAEDVAKSTPEYQLPLEERRIFAVPSAATSVILQSGVANLAWLELEKLRNPS